MNKTSVAKQMNRTSLAVCATLIGLAIVMVLTTCLTPQRTYIDCGPSQLLCGTSCANILTDPNNCGACGDDPTLQVTVDGGDGSVTMIVDAGGHPHICDTDGSGGCVNGTCGILCSGGRTGCSGACVDTNVDPNNCGSCGHACTGDGFCVDGGCVLECEAPLVACPAGYQSPPPDSGVATADASTSDSGTVIPLIIGPVVVSTCSTLLNDSANCGGCGFKCAGGYECDGGTCTPSCPALAHVCNGQCVDVRYDQNNCGACNNACKLTQRCSYSICCSLPLTGCPAAGDAGSACVDTTSNNTNCGGCGISCYGIGTDTCVNGLCQ